MGQVAIEPFNIDAREWFTVSFALPTKSMTAKTTPAFA
jgi:hypothetical protein